MCAFDLFKLVIKNALRVIWVCLIFALLFAIVLFVSFVKGELSEGFYDDIMSEAGNGYLSAVCDYSPDSDEEIDIGVYYSSSGETYNVTVSGIGVDSYSRGFNICKVFSVWQNYITGSPLQTGTGGIWIYDVIADNFGICAGQSVVIAGDEEKTFTVMGTYSAAIVESFGVAYIPSFLICEGNAREDAVIIVSAQDVYSLYLTDIGKTVTDDDGIMDLCEGYYLARICFTALLAFFCIAALLLAVKIINYIIKHFSVQNFLFSVFGLPRKKQWLSYFVLLGLFGLVSLAAGIGIFYILAGVTQKISLIIMSMKFTAISPGMPVLYSFLAYIAAAAVTIIFTLRKRTGGE